MSNEHEAAAKYTPELVVLLRKARPHLEAERLIEKGRGIRGEVDRCPVRQICKSIDTILAELDALKPDPLLIEAREIAATSCEKLDNPTGAECIRSGQWDNCEGLVSTALRALKRGIELAGGK